MTSSARLLTAKQAVSYLGYKSCAVLRNLPFPPLRIAEVGIGKGPRYDRKALDDWLDRKSGLERPSAESSPMANAQSAFDEWKLRREGKVA